MPEYRAFFTASGSVVFTAEDEEDAARVAASICSRGAPTGAYWDASVELVDIQDEDEPPTL